MGITRRSIAGQQVHGTLVVLPNTREVADDVDTQRLQEAAISDARALEYGGRAERACGDHDELARSGYAHRFVFAWADARVWQVFDPDCVAIPVRIVQGSISRGHVQRQWGH